MKEVTAYMPDCCNKAMLSKSSAIRHERRCPHNPQNRACPTCANYTTEKETYYNPYHNGDPGSTDYDYDTYWCDHDTECPKEITDIKMSCENWKPLVAVKEG